MSRPLKTGLDYFRMDVEMDDKVELIEAKHGILGFGILVKLYQRIYKEGYFLKLTEETLLIFSKRVNVDINKVNEVINDCLRYQLFDENLHKKYQILTSPGIQKRYLQAIDRRKDIELIQNYIIVDINGLNVNINWVNVDISTQSKVKDSKVKQSKEEKSKSDETFAFWYSEYPRKEAKQDAIKAWNKLQKSMPELSVMVDKLKKQIQVHNWTQENIKYIPLPASYLNGKRWEDVIEEPEKAQTQFLNPFQMIAQG